MNPIFSHPLQKYMLKMIGLPCSRFSFSQFGEDLIIAGILRDLAYKNISYLDIGSHHPFELNNTAYFYKMGYKGVCVEPNPDYFKLLKKNRKRDICLNVGVGKTAVENANFYLSSGSSLATFSEDEAHQLSTFGIKTQQVLNIPLLTANEIIKQYFNPYPNIISIDVEGLELDILEAFDFQKFKPEVFCVETLTFSTNNTGHKCTAIIEFMTKNGYFVFADTHLNTIFVENSCWKNRNCDVFI